ncbi:MAG: RusA family crossover junction endodeoxyribonuclease [Clostridia bacterium]|nr:RusA family crossover junction endodeoxyribonuclease [Clostridia bacterium]
MIVSFTIDGEPREKGRPRFTKSGSTYTPKETSEYEALAAMAYKGTVGRIDK